MTSTKPRPPFRAEDGELLANVLDANGYIMAVWCKAAYPDWRDRQTAEVANLTERFTLKCPIRKGNDGDDALPWYVVDAGGEYNYWRTEAECDVVYDALVALWHKENDSP